MRDGEHFTPAFQNCDKVIALAVAALPVEVRAERLKTLFGPPHKVQNADPNCRNEGERTLVDTARAVQALERVPGPDIDAFLLDMSRNPNAYCVMDALELTLVWDTAARRNVAAIRPLLESVANGSGTAAFSFRKESRLSLESAARDALTLLDRAV